MGSDRGTRVTHSHGEIIFYLVLTFIVAVAALVFLVISSYLTVDRIEVLEEILFTPTPESVQ